MALLIAALLRFYLLGSWPPGPYRDEAYNGLDALRVLRGNHALFFPANNGREPAYIYLVAAAIALLGPTTLALRLPSAIVGTLTTVPVYLLGRAWFGRTAGLLAAFLWAATFWPVHLGRIGLRAGLLAPLLAIAFWLGTRAYRESRAGLWFAAGLIYGLTFYTYLAARLTPLLLVLVAVYLVATGRRRRLWDAGRVLWFLPAAVLVVAPLAMLFRQDPSLILGRAGQVSILSPAVHEGDLAGTLLQQAGRVAGMFIWRGDTILRHNGLLNYEAVLPWENPAGRPVFDVFMAVPFLIGLGWCVWRWRRPAAAVLVLWQLVMLIPTVLAADAPHFLRAAGLLPGTVFFPAIGLGLLWHWDRWPVAARHGAVILLLLGSLALTIGDYSRYARQPDVGFLFEAAAADLAESARSEPAAVNVFLDQRFPDGWPSVPFLLNNRPVTTFRPEEGLPAIVDQPAVVYAWPYGPLDFLPAAVEGPATIAVESGPLARGDLEPEPYPLYTRYAVTPGDLSGETVANFDDRYRLLEATATLPDPDTITLDLGWLPATGGDAPGSPSDTLPNLFIHVTGRDGMIVQYDGPLVGGLWPAAWWRPGLSLHEKRVLKLPISFDPVQHQVTIGLYWPDTGERLPVVDDRGAILGDHIVVMPKE